MSALSELETRIDAAEEAGRYDEAIELLGELATRADDDVRWHIAWMHTRAGHEAEAEAIWSVLRAERPGDPGIPYLEAAALLEDERDERALPLLEQALELGLAAGSDETLLRRVADDRLTALGRARARPSEVDHRARELLARHVPATPWFVAAQLVLARERWPAPAGGVADHGAYCAAIDRDLRGRVTAAGAQRPVLVAIDVDEVERFAAEHGWEPGWPVTRDQVAAAALRENPERGRVWPPGRNEPCWCGSQAKYKRCCGSGR